MSTQTTNLGLTIRTGSENVSRQIINGNFAIIDDAVGKPSSLATTDKSNVVNAVNEIHNKVIKKANVLEKTTGDGNTFTIKFTKANSYAFVFGQFGYGYSTLSMAVICFHALDIAAVQSFGDQSLSVSTNGYTVTVTTPQTYAIVTVVSSDDIE